MNEAGLRRADEDGQQESSAFRQEGYSSNSNNKKGSHNSTKTKTSSRKAQKPFDAKGSKGSSLKRREARGGAASPSEQQPLQQLAGQPSGEGGSSGTSATASRSSTNSSPRTAAPTMVMQQEGARRDGNQRRDPPAGTTDDNDASSSAREKNDDAFLDETESDGDSSNSATSSQDEVSSSTSSDSIVDSDAPSSTTTDSLPQPALQLTVWGIAALLEEGNKNQEKVKLTNDTAGVGVVESSNEESSSSMLRPKAWMSTEEYLPSSCSSSDAEDDDSDDSDSLEEEDSFAGSSDSSSSDSSSSFLDQEGLEYVEYFTGDEQDRKALVFLHMPPPPPPPRAMPKQQQQQQQQQQVPSPTEGHSPRDGHQPNPIGASVTVVPPALALREPLGASRPAAANAPMEIKIRPADLLSQMTSPSNQQPPSSSLQDMPPLVDLVEIEEVDDEDDSEENDDTSSSNSSSGSDDSSESGSSSGDDDSDDESSIDESELLDIIHPGHAFQIPPQRRTQTVAAPPQPQKKPTSNSVPPRVSVQQPQPRSAPKPVPAVASRGATASTSAPPARPPPTSPRIPMELQAVFLASQQGEVVDKPPESGAAFRVFGSWFGRRNKQSTKDVTDKNNSGARLLPSLLSRRQKPPQEGADHGKDGPEPVPSLRTKSGASRRISQFFKRKQHLSSSFRRMPQLPEISEVSCSIDATTVVEPIGLSSGGGGAPDASLRSRSSSASGVGSITEGDSPSGTPAGSPLRRTFSVRSFGSSRRSSIGSAVSASSAASSAATSANHSSSAASGNRLGKSVASSSVGSRSRHRPSDVSASYRGSRCSSQSCASGTTATGSQPIASIASSDDNSTHSWDSDVSDLSSEDEALYADLEQILSRAKDTLGRSKAPATGGPTAAAAAPASFAPTVPSFKPKPPVSAPSPQGHRSKPHVNVYVPASPTPRPPGAPPSRSASSADVNDPVTPVITASSKSSKGSSTFEPTIPSFPDKKKTKSSLARQPPVLSSQKPKPAPPQPSSTTSRIPVELQEIFLRSNGGEDVEDIAPPSNGSGFKVFSTWRSGSVWAPLLRRPPSRRPLLVPNKSQRQLSSSTEKGRRPSTAHTVTADKSVQSFTANTVDTSSPLSAPSSPLTRSAAKAATKAPKEIVYVPRIPEELQEIFLESNRGNDVHHPPRSGSAFQVFERREEEGHRRVHQKFRLLSSRGLP